MGRVQDQVAIVTGGANAMLFLASPEASYITGHTLSVAGGL
jgi:Enoyl-(Acyl carrier protein) reductase